MSTCEIAPYLCYIRLLLTHLPINYRQPGTGHGLPLHNNAQLGFRAMFDWLHKNGF